MYPLAITMVFITLLGIFTTAEIKSFSSSQVERNLQKNYIDAKQQLHICRAKALYDNAKGEEPKTKKDKNGDPPPPKEKADPIERPAPLKINATRPPNNSRLNFALLFDGHETNWERKWQSYELFAALIRKLYGKHPLFASFPNCEYLILDKLIAQKEKAAGFTTPDEMARLSLGDSKLQEVFYLMLKGSSGALSPACPSLLFYTTMDNRENWTAKQHKINFFFTSKEILEVIIDNENVVSSLLTYRTALLSKILSQEENRLNMRKEEGINRSQIRDELKQIFAETLCANGLDPTQYLPIFDFSLGKIGNILIFKDPTTGITIREKLPN